MLGLPGCPQTLGDPRGIQRLILYPTKDGVHNTFRESLGGLESYVSLIYALLVRRTAAVVHRP